MPGTPSCADELARLFGRDPAGDPATADDPCASAERHPGGWASASACWIGDEEVARTVARHLSAGERAHFDRLDALRGRSWLAGRLAVKEAVRWWLADRGDDVAPGEIDVADDTAGRPFLRGRGSAVAARLAGLDLRVSVAHLFGVGVGIVAQATPVGIGIAELVPSPAVPPAGAPVAGELPDQRLDAELPCCGAVGRDRALLADGADTAAACAREAAARCRAGGARAGGPCSVTAVGPDLYLVDDQLVRCAVLDPDRFCSQAGHPLVVSWTVTGRDLDLRPDPRPARAS